MSIISSKIFSLLNCQHEDLQERRFLSKKMLPANNYIETGFYVIIVLPYHILQILTKIAMHCNCNCIVTVGFSKVIHDTRYHQFLVTSVNKTNRHGEIFKIITFLTLSR